MVRCLPLVQGAQVNMNVIAFASHTALMRSQNTAYTQAYQRIQHLQHELDHLKKENISLLAQKEAYQCVSNHLCCRFKLMLFEKCIYCSCRLRSAKSFSQ